MACLDVAFNPLFILLYAWRQHAGYEATAIGQTFRREISDRSLICGQLAAIEFAKPASNRVAWSSVNAL